MNEYILEDEGKNALFHIALAYAGSIKTEKAEIKRLISAMVVEYINREDITPHEKEDIWDELTDLAIDYMMYILKHIDKENKDERKDN